MGSTMKRLPNAIYPAEFFYLPRLKSCFYLTATFARGRHIFNDDNEATKFISSYPEDKDESVIEADVEYLRLTRKVISDEITKFEDLKWLVGWFNNRSDLIQEHSCNTRYYAVGKGHSYTTI
jgi:hypothetical protein